MKRLMHAPYVGNQSARPSPVPIDTRSRRNGPSRIGLCLGLLLASIATLLFSGRAGADTVTITAPLTVGPTATTIRSTGSPVDVPLASAEIIVRGTTLTMNGRFTIASLKLENNSVLTHSQGHTFNYGGTVVNGLSLTINGTASTSCGAGISLCIDAGSSIDVSGRGAAGGQGPGAGRTVPQSCCTSGAGYGGDGGSGESFADGRMSYGAALDQPIDFGSGGGNTSNGTGGAGGGDIRLDIVGAIRLNGTVAAAGGNGAGNGAGGGSGGSIWITTGTMDGAGTILANGGAGHNTDCCAPIEGGGGGGGRISLSYAASSFTGQIQCYGGNGFRRGGAGTIYSRVGMSVPRVDLDNATISGERSVFPGDSFTGNVFIRGGARLGPTDGQLGWHFILDGNMTLENGGSVDANGRGHSAGQGPGAGYSAPQACCTSGAGFGGDGGFGQNFSGGRISYGSSVDQPTELGSGGGSASGGTGGEGGGALRLTVSGTLTILENGGIGSAGNGGSGNGSGGGSGGSIWISAGALAGVGSIYAHGGTGHNTDCCNPIEGGGGGGGRIAVAYNSTTFTGQMQAFGGNGYQRGGAGTIYTRLGSAAPGVLLDNATVFGERSTFPGDTFIGNVTIRNAARLGPTYGQTGWHFVLLGNMTVDSGGSVDAFARGFGGGLGPANGQNATGCCTSGGTYGGTGGRGQNNTVVGQTYGSGTRPIDLGSGGGNAAGVAGGSGGGALRLSVSGTLTVNGSVHSDGASGTGNGAGGGSGGSVWISAGTLAGTGSIHATGGAGHNTDCCNPIEGGGGGGGRVAVYACARASDAPVPTATGGLGFQAGSTGSVTNTATVSLDVTPSQLVLCRSNDVTFTIPYIPGLGTPLVQWLRNGEDLVDGSTETGSVISGSQTRTLTIQNADGDDIAVYSARINPVGSPCPTTMFTTNGQGRLRYCRGDFNCDMVVNSQDFFDFLSCFFTPGCTSADFNSDGFTNSQDFFDFVAAFFAGCP